MNGVTVGELNEDLCERFKDLTLKIVPQRYLESSRVLPTVMHMIKEDEKEEMEEIRNNMSKGKAKGFHEDDQGAYGLRSTTTYHVTPSLGR